MNFVEPIREADKIEAIEYHLKRSSPRNYIMFMIGVHTGLRISDILRLKVVDINHDSINIREKKTNKQRNIKLHRKLRQPLSTFIEGRDPKEYVIKSRQGSNKPLTRYGAYSILKQLEKQFKLEPTGTHTLRKTFGYHHYKNTNDIATLQRIFNHTDPAETLRYIGIRQDDVDAAITTFKYYRK